MNTIINLLLVLCLFTGCAPNIKINYSGETLPATRYADIFFNFKEVKKEYRVIGEAILKAPISCDPIKLEGKLRKLAEEKGADAVVIISFKTITIVSREINPDWGYLTYDPNYIEGPNNYGPTAGTMVASEDIDPQDTYKYITTYDFLIKSDFIVYGN